MTSELRQVHDTCARFFHGADQCPVLSPGRPRIGHLVHVLRFQVGYAEVRRSWGAGHDGPEWVTLVAQHAPYPARLRQ